MSRPKPVFEEYQVRLNEEGKRICKKSPPERTGTVKGEGKTGVLRILWDGTKTLQSLSKSFVEKV